MKHQPLNRAQRAFLRGRRRYFVTTLAAFDDFGVESIIDATTVEWNPVNPKHHRGFAALHAARNRRAP